MNSGDAREYPCQIYEFSAFSVAREQSYRASPADGSGPSRSGMKQGEWAPGENDYGLPPRDFRMPRKSSPGEQEISRESVPLQGKTSFRA